MFHNYHLNLNLYKTVICKCIFHLLPSEDINDLDFPPLYSHNSLSTVYDKRKMIWWLEHM